MTEHAVVGLFLNPVSVLSCVCQLTYTFKHVMNFNHCTAETKLNQVYENQELEAMTKVDEYHFYKLLLC